MKFAQDLLHGPLFLRGRVWMAGLCSDELKLSLHRNAPACLGLAVIAGSIPLRRFAGLCWAPGFQLERDPTVWPAPPASLRAAPLPRPTLTSALAQMGPAPLAFLRIWRREAGTKGGSPLGTQSGPWGRSAASQRWEKLGWVDRTQKLTLQGKGGLGKTWA